MTREPAEAATAPARLKRRAEFLRVAKGQRVGCSLFTLQGAPRPECDAGSVRFGLTVTKKAGNAVVRNRLRRRMREVLRLAPDLPVTAGHDYVLVIRREALAVSFAMIGAELRRSLRRATARSPSPSRTSDADRDTTPRAPRC